MRYQFDQIEAFLQVLEAGSISAAAERLNLAKSAVSKRLAALERTLGVELVRRSARGIVPPSTARPPVNGAPPRADCRGWAAAARTAGRGARAFPR